MNDTDEDSTLEAAASYQASSDLSANRGNTGRQGEEGVCLYINYKWCRRITVREQPCSPGCCPGCWRLFFIFFFNLLKKLPRIFVLVVNIHISWIKSLKWEKPFKFRGLPHTCRTDFCRRLFKSKVKRDAATSESPAMWQNQWQVPATLRARGVGVGGSNSRSLVFCQSSWLHVNIRWEESSQSGGKNSKKVPWLWECVIGDEINKSWKTASTSIYLCIYLFFSKLAL